MAALRLIRLDLPFHADYMTQRVLFASEDLITILRHHYDDPRHPQLFYLVLHFWEWGGIGEAWMRLPAVLASLATAAMLVVLARPYVGTAGALCAAALLGLSAPFLNQSRDVSDLPLFLFLALLSSHLLLRVLQRPSRGWIVGYTLAAVAMAYTYYLAGAVLAVQLVAMLVGWRQPGARRLLRALAAVVLLAIPAWWDLLLVIRDDTAIRQVARQYSGHLWGEQNAAQYLAQVGDQLLPTTGPWLVIPVLALVGVFRWGLAGVSRPALVLLAGLGLAGVGIAVAGVEHVRLAPHYLMFAFPPLLILAVAGALGPRDEFGGAPRAAPYRRGLAIGGAAALAVVAALYAVELGYRAPDVWDRGERDEYLLVTDVIRDGGGPDHVVGDPDMLHTILLYYAFPDPLAAYHTCHRGSERAQLTCHSEAGTLTLLTSMGRMSDGWEERSLARFQTLRDQPLWFVDVESFANEPLRDEVRASCDLRAQEGKLALYRCEPGKD